MIGVAILGSIVIARGFVIGSASPDGTNFRREDEPFAFWLIMSCATIAVLFLCYLGLRDL